jgi:cytidylate kinase
MAKIISITGDLGSGKSTVSNILCERLKYDYIYTGEIQRRIAGRYRMSTTELNKYSETHPEIDREIDSTFKSLNNSENLVVDSRLAWFFIPGSFKVFLKTNLLISSERISNDAKRMNEKYASKEEAVFHIVERKTSENKRYAELYGADCSVPGNFNLILDASFIEPEKVAGIVIKEFDAWTAAASQPGTVALISPQNLYPTQPAGGFSNEGFKRILDSMKINGYDSNYPIAVVTADSFDYILDGHKRTSCAIQNRIDLIPVVYKDGNTNFACKDRILDSIPSNLFSDWEDFNSFKYLIYPNRK